MIRVTGIEPESLAKPCVLSESMIMISESGTELLVWPQLPPAPTAPASRGVALRLRLNGTVPANKAGQYSVQTNLARPGLLAMAVHLKLPPGPVPL